MAVNKIMYKGKRIKLIWEKVPDCLGIFDPNINTLHIDPKLTPTTMAKIIFHELWHIICYFNQTNINLIGEEKTALHSEQYAVILKNNPKLKRLLDKCLKPKKKKNT